MHRGESDHFTEGSNRLNLPDIIKNANDPDFNSDTFIGFVNKLPI